VVDAAVEEMIVCNACIELDLRANRVDILLLESLCGDIASNLSAGLVGGLGVVPGANLGTHQAFLEAVHGTAPDIAGKNMANPVAVSRFAGLMLHHLKW
jgi:isocitrate dehydrogenase (NAD+)